MSKVEKTVERSVNIKCMCPEQIWRKNTKSAYTTKKRPGEKMVIAFHAGVFKGARISSLFLVGREGNRAPLKTPAWEAKMVSTS